MANGIEKAYLEAAYKHFKLQPTFPPGTLVEVGWIGKIENGQFVRTSQLSDYGVSFGKRSVDVPAMRFASSGAVDFLASAKGTFNKAVGAIGKADAGLKIAFKKDAAIAIILDPVRETFIRNVDAVSKWMKGPGRNKLSGDHVVITHVRHAKSGVIAMAQSGGAEVQLKTDVALGDGRIELAKVGGKFNLVTSKSTEFVSIPSGRSGLTPFFRVLTYNRGKWWNPFDDDEGVGFQRLFQEVGPDITQFPYDIDAFERMR